MRTVSVAIFRRPIVASGLKKKNGGSVSTKEKEERHAVVLRHLEPVVKHLQKARTKLQNPKVTLADREGAAAAVEALVDCIRQSFNKKLLSASSKLLNMLGVELPLFDSWARKGLNKELGLKLPGGVAYSDYHAAWVESYMPRRESYLAALAALDEEVKDGAIAQMGAEWLCVRAHDIRLMRLGGAK